MLPDGPAVTTDQKVAENLRAEQIAHMDHEDDQSRHRERIQQFIGCKQQDVKIRFFGQSQRQSHAASERHPRYDHRGISPFGAGDIK